MPRREAPQDNTLTIQDQLSDSEIKLSYRMPTTKERQGFQNLAVQRRRNKVEMNQAEARLTYGMKILTGVRDGDFERLQDGAYVPLSSREGSDHYYPEWKSWMGEHAADLVMLLGAHVFEQSAMITAGDEDQEGNDGDEDVEGK